MIAIGWLHVRRVKASTIALMGAAALAYASVSAAAVQLVPVVDGLFAPVFATGAGDGSERLFVVEQGGSIRVLQPGASTTTVFLDIGAKLIAGGERGLLGLAFHPHFASNRRFFVYYTRAGDGALVIGEYRVSDDRDVALEAESVVLTIAHPVNENHNGGMLAFGPDGYLYVGVGDGGSGDDPPDNAQNLDVLLGKILRIDVDRADASAGTPYSAPADNPFVGVPGRDEIHAYGLRNPWRFSFDRVTGVMWAADVGQNMREEVDMPIVRGGNYGWRVYEGLACTGNAPSRCDPASYRPPILDYAHADGRCAIVGGYVYRGRRQAVAGGAYIYGDYCSGEIFAWDGATQTVLLDTARNVSSFAEDDEGELYVLDLGGTVSRIAAAAPCVYSLAPTDATFARNGGAGSTDVTTSPGCTWTAASSDAWIVLDAAQGGTGSGSVGYTVAPYAGAADAKRRSGTIAIADSTFTVTQTRLRPPARRDRS